MKKPFFLIVLILFCLFICFNYNLNSASQPKPAEKIIALTFDDGPRPKILLGENGLISILEKYNVKATFFLIGAELLNPENQKASSELFLKGHELENHAYSHTPLSKLKKRFNEEKIFEELEKTSRLIQQITKTPENPNGIKPRFFRPPTWDIWPDIKRQIEDNGYTVCTIPVNGIKMPVEYQDVNFEDYCFALSKLQSYCSGEMRKYHPSRISDYVKKIIQDREKQGIYQHILVFHELKISKESLEKLIPYFQKQGYQFVTLDEYYKIIKKGGEKK